MNLLCICIIMSILSTDSLCAMSKSQSKKAPLSSVSTKKAPSRTITGKKSTTGAVEEESIEQATLATVGLTPSQPRAVSLTAGKKNISTKVVQKTTPIARSYAIDLSTLADDFAKNTHALQSFHTVLTAPIDDYVAAVQQAPQFKKVAEIVPELLPTYTAVYIDTATAKTTPQQFAQDTYATPRGKISSLISKINVFKSPIAPWIDYDISDFGGQNLYKGLTFLNDFFENSPDISKQLSMNFTSQDMADRMQNYVIPLRARYPLVSDKVLASFVTVFFKDHQHKQMTPMKVLESLDSIEDSFNTEGVFDNEKVKTDVQKMYITLKTVQKAHHLYHAQLDSVSQQVEQEQINTIAFNKKVDDLDKQFVQIKQKQDAVHAAVQQKSLLAEQEAAVVALQKKEEHDAVVGNIVSYLKYSDKVEIISCANQLQRLHDVSDKNSLEFKQGLRDFNTQYDLALSADQLDDVLAGITGIRNQTVTGQVINATAYVAHTIGQGVSRGLSFMTGSSNNSEPVASINEGALLAMNPTATPAERVLYTAVENYLTAQNIVIGTVTGAIGSIAVAKQSEIIRIIAQTLNNMQSVQNNSNFTSAQKDQAQHDISRTMFEQIAAIVIADKTGADTEVVAATGLLNGKNTSLAEAAEQIATNAFFNQLITGLSGSKQTSSQVESPYASTKKLPLSTSLAKQDTTSPYPLYQNLLLQEDSLQAS